MFCSDKARKIIDTIPGLEPFYVDVALQYGSIVMIRNLIKKKNLEAACAMGKKGYFKKFPKKLEFDLEELEDTYLLITTFCLNSDFLFSELEALPDIAKFPGHEIVSAFSESKVKSFWYIRKILESNNSIDARYTHVKELNLKESTKGNQFNTEELKQYVE